jgi:oligoendopeptidase F
VTQYKYDAVLNAKAEKFGGVADLGRGLRSLDSHVRKTAARKMSDWLESVGAVADDVFREHTALAAKKRFNIANIDANERTLEIARRVALDRAPELSEKYFQSLSQDIGSELVWHDRYKPSAYSSDIKRWKQMKTQVLRLIDELHPAMSKTANSLIDAKSLIQPKGRGGGFTTPVFYSERAKGSAGPFIYAPFDGSDASGRTLIHELGHGVHACLSSDLGPMLSDSGWAVAETVALTCEQAYLKADKRSFIDQDFAMLVHQPAIAMFERESGVLNADIPLNTVWMTSMREHYGPNVSLENYDSFWRRHSSTVSATGYPMAYFLGWALACYATQRMMSAENSVRKGWMEILTSGGKLGYEDAAACLGVRDMSELFHRAFDQAENRIRQRFDA